MDHQHRHQIARAARRNPPRTCHVLHGRRRDHSTSPAIMRSLSKIGKVQFDESVREGDKDIFTLGKIWVVGLWGSDERK